MHIKLLVCAVLSICVLAGLAVAVLANKTAPKSEKSLVKRDVTSVPNLINTTEEAQSTLAPTLPELDATTVVRTARKSFGFKNRRLYRKSSSSSSSSSEEVGSRRRYKNGRRKSNNGRSNRRGGKEPMDIDTPEETQYYDDDDDADEYQGYDNYEYAEDPPSPRHHHGRVRVAAAAKGYEYHDQNDYYDSYNPPIQPVQPGNGIFLKPENILGAVLVIKPSDLGINFGNLDAGGVRPSVPLYFAAAV